MKVSQKKLENSGIELSFELEWQEFSPYFDRAFSELSKDLKIAGFRPGMVPRQMAEKHLEQSVILKEAAELAVRKKYPDYILENNLQIIGQPQIEITKLAKGNPLCFKVKVDILPEIKLPDYKKIASKTKKAENVPVEEKEIEASLKWLQQSRAKFEESKEAVKKGNFLEIEYQSPSLENNKLFQDSFIQGEGYFIPGFEDNLLEMKTGQKKDFEVKFPNDYKDKKLAGKNVPFKVEIKKIHNLKLPELNDEFAKKLGNFENLTALRKNIEEGLGKEKDSQERQRIRKEILENIAQETKVEIPASLIGHEQEHMLVELKEKIKEVFKTPFEQYLKNIGKSETEIKDSFKREAEKRVKELLLMKEIGKKENIVVEDKEIAAAVNNFLKNFPDPKKAEELDPERLKAYYREVIFNEKTLKKLETYVTNHSNNH